MALLSRLLRRPSGIAEARSRRARVLELHRRGLDAHEIAREVGSAHDVVRLVLATSGAETQAR